MVNSVMVDTPVTVIVAEGDAVDMTVIVSGNIIVVTDAPPLESHDKIGVVVRMRGEAHVGQHPTAVSPKVASSRNHLDCRLDRGMSGLARRWSRLRMLARPIDSLTGRTRRLSRGRGGWGE